MIGVLSAMIVAVGTAFAFAAARRPRHRQIMETCGGVLLIAGFALLGYLLESIFGRP